ncbi:hypothetical protein CEG14_06195 [Bordetella genomosp. 1]|uniref:ASCH domain-containing protein n=1 Tax=Bordetella genomosp. 1 TaxID=1395607 RepID=A0A261SP08_9BORD|nr:hypothetical protein [Bordetella genomosp. 1]OZI39118.1 hypothetical protein CEG14_06195 [Bordetella genomosp. 1]
MKAQALPFAQTSVPAILAGTRRQTRRILKPQPPPNTRRWYCDPRSPERWLALAQDAAVGALPDQPGWIVCPFGRPGGLVPLTLLDGTPFAHAFLLGIRVQRLQSISTADALAESCTSVQDFAQAWSERYGQAAWGANPWVWALDFRLARQDGGEGM